MFTTLPLSPFVLGDWSRPVVVSRLTRLVTGSFLDVKRRACPSRSAVSDKGRLHLTQKDKVSAAVGEARSSSVLGGTPTPRVDYGRQKRRQQMGQDA